MLKYINYYNGTNIQILNIPSIVYAIVALAINSAAFNSVVIQSAFESVNKGEIEAATALGMTGAQRMVRIIIPEAVELALPSLGNQLIGLLKGTSLAFTCAVVEMTAKGKLLGAIGFRYFEAYVALAVLYWIITIVFEQIIKLIINSVKVPDVAGEEKGRIQRWLKSRRGKNRKKVNVGAA
jgi:polar amino acid transport system permease protein